MEIPSNLPAHNVQRVDRMVFSRTDLPVFSMHLERTILEVSGDTSENFAVDLCAAAGAASENDADALLKEIKLTRSNQMLSTSVPAYAAGAPSQAFVQVQAPQESPIKADGDYSAIRVVGMNAPVNLSTTHARITLLDTTGDVDARAQSGLIDFSGSRGHVRLDADWDVTLYFNAQHFDGSLDAKAGKAVRVVLTPGFASAFEAVVQRKSDFACRADICDHVVSHKKNGKFVFTFGSGEPILQFTSLNGIVVIDSVDRLPAINRMHLP